MGPARLEVPSPAGIRKNFSPRRTVRNGPWRCSWTRSPERPSALNTRWPSSTGFPCRPHQGHEEATIALVSSGGIVPKGNPDHIPSRVFRRNHGRLIFEAGRPDPGDLRVVHGGYDQGLGLRRPDVVLPVDVMRETASARAFSPSFTTTSTRRPDWNGRGPRRAFRPGIGAQLKEAGVDRRDPDSPEEPALDAAHR